MFFFWGGGGALEVWGLVRRIFGFAFLGSKKFKLSGFHFHQKINGICSADLQVASPPPWLIVGQAFQMLSIWLSSRQLDAYA